MIIKRVVFSVLILLFLRHTLIAQKATISGYISDKESGEKLINANIYNTETLEGSTANTFGFYSIKLNKGKINLIVSYMGYSPQNLSLNLTKDTIINIKLFSKSDQIDEVTVNGNNFQNKIESSQMSMNEISPQKLQKIPQILGESDVLKAMQLLPGVKSGMDGTCGLYVRGGGADQNLYLLDGIPVYNATHIMGFFSAFNPDAIKSAKIYKGGFPAHYGGRLSSVVDINMKDGNMKKLDGNFSIGLLSSKLMLEGPIVRDKTSFMVSARRSYFDLLAKPIFALSNTDEKKYTLGAYFYDYNLKLNHKFSDRSRLFLSGYFGDDNYHDSDYSIYSDGEKEKLKYTVFWKNSIGSARWNYQLNNKLFSNTTLSYNRYHFKTKDSYYGTYISNSTDTTNSYDDCTYSSGIEDYSARLDFDFYPGPKHSIKFGANFTNHYFSPGVYHTKSNEYSDVLDTVIGNSNILSTEYSAYIEDDFSVSKNIKINAGIYTSLYNVEGVNYLKPQPRFSIRYKANDNWSLKASYSRMAQHIHLLSYTGISQSTDIWVPATKKYEPPVSDQIAIGTAINLPHNLSLSAEAFYKTMDNLLEYKDGASYTSISSDWEDLVEKGKGWSYGAEFMLEKNTGKTTGWIAYTLAWNNRKFANLNHGKTFPDKYDRRHDISIALTHKFSKKIDIGATWIYNTGNMATLALTQYKSANILGSDYSADLNNIHSRNNYRMPANHRLDLGINFHKQRPRSLRTWSISLYNAYNHHNPFYIYWDSNSSNITLKKYCILPVIPSISYSLKF